MIIRGIGLDFWWTLRLKNPSFMIIDPSHKRHNISFIDTYSIIKYTMDGL